MIQTYTIVLWIDKQRRTAEEMVQILHTIFDCMGHLDPRAVPRYETVWRKRDAVALDGSEESLKQVVSAAMKKMPASKIKNDQ